MEILTFEKSRWIDLFLREWRRQVGGGGAGGRRDKPECPDTNPDSQSENRYRIKGENPPPQPGIEPGPSSKVGDKFPWSDRSGDN